MRNTIYTISILILFQSCCSYKTFDIKDYETIKPKKIKIKLKNSNIIKGEPISFKNDTLKLKTISKIKKIPKLEIQTIKQQKFSWLKTHLLSATISLSVLATLFYSIIKGIGNIPINGT